MSNWADIISGYEKNRNRSVLVTVGAVRGSTPRETGARMLVTEEEIIGTIGGGRLEYLAIEQARSSLKDETASKTQTLNLPLGPELAQCCGGYVDVLLCKLSVEDQHWLNQINSALTDQAPSLLLTNYKEGAVTRSIISNPQNLDTIDDALKAEIRDSLEKGKSGVIQHGENPENKTLIEPINGALFHLTLFGAGHVGKAVVHTLSQLPCTITWIDERADMFPERLPYNVQKIVSDVPIDQTRSAHADSYFLVMTHSHQLDLELCIEILKRENVQYLGLIGSQTKRQKFLKRLKLRGFGEQGLSKLTCPIGLPQLTGKHPAQIAISVSAELLGLAQAKEQKNSISEKTDVTMLNG